MAFSNTRKFKRFWKRRTAKVTPSRSISIPRPKNSYRMGTHLFTRSLVERIGLTDTTTRLVSYANIVATGHISLSQFPNYSEFTALFDRYKIVKVKQTFMFTANSANAGEGESATMVGNVLPFIHSVLDYDDGTAMSIGSDSLDEAIQYETHKCRRLDKTFTRTFYPKLSTILYKGGVSDAYGTPGKSPWVDCNDAGVQYYGHKYIFDKSMAGNTNDGIGWVVLITKAWILCKDTR